MTADEIKKTKNYKSIRGSLLNQLKQSGNDTPHFIDLVEDYMKMYVVKEMASAAVLEYGVTVEYRNSATQYGMKKNDAVDQFLKTNQQMLKLLDMLGIKADVKEAEDLEEL